MIKLYVNNLYFLKTKIKISDVILKIKRIKRIIIEFITKKYPIVLVNKVMFKFKSNPQTSTFCCHFLFFQYLVQWISSFFIHEK